MALSTSLRRHRYAGSAATARLIEAAAEEIAAARRLQAAGDYAGANGLLDLAAQRLTITTRSGRSK